MIEPFLNYSVAFFVLALVGGFACWDQFQRGRYQARILTIRKTNDMMLEAALNDAATAVSNLKQTQDIINDLEKDRANQIERRKMIQNVYTPLANVSQRVTQSLNKAEAQIEILKQENKSYLHKIRNHLAGQDHLISQLNSEKSLSSRYKNKLDTAVLQINELEKRISLANNQ